MEIVLVHIGTKLPAHIYDCVAQIKSKSELPIVLITDSSVCIDGVEVKEVATPKDTFLEGFWAHTFNRLKVLSEHMTRAPKKPVLHIENDVLIYHDPLEYANVFSDIAKGRVLMTPLGNDHLSAAYTYAPTSKSMGILWVELCKHMGMGQKELVKHTGYHFTSEMTLLDHIYKNHSGLIELLPILRGDPHYDRFNSVFDPASYGQYLGGIQNAPGVAWAGDHHFIGKKINKGEILPVFEDGKPYATEGPDKYPINNLHIHSKQLKEFMG